LRQAYRHTQAIVKNLADRVGHPTTAGVVKQGHILVNRIGNDHHVPAFPLQLIDRGKLLSIFQEDNVFATDQASAILPHAVRGEVNRIFNKATHCLLRELSHRLRPRQVDSIRSSPTMHGRKRGIYGFFFGSSPMQMAFRRCCPEPPFTLHGRA